MRLYYAKMGAYTELQIGLSTDLGIEEGGKYIMPWKCLYLEPRPDFLAALKTQEGEGTGVAAQLLEYFEKQRAEFK